MGIESGISILTALSVSKCVCNSGNFVLDVQGEHSHRCNGHSGTTKDAHEHIMAALEKICLS